MENILAALEQIIVKLFYFRKDLFSLILQFFSYFRWFYTI